MHHLTLFNSRKAAEPIYYPVSIHKTVLLSRNPGADLYVSKVDGTIKKPVCILQSKKSGEKNVCDRFTSDVKNVDGPCNLPADLTSGRAARRRDAILAAGHSNTQYAANGCSTAERNAGPDPISARTSASPFPNRSR